MTLVSDGELAPRNGTVITDAERLHYIARHLHSFDNYGVDNVSVCLGTMPEEPGAYILTRSASQFWAWYFEDAEEAAASFRHFEASTYSDWSYCFTDGGLLPLIYQNGFLPQLQIESAPEGNIRFYRSSTAHHDERTPVLLRFPWPDNARPDEKASSETDDEGRVHHHAWFTDQVPLPIEIDLFIDGDWYPVAELGRSLQVTSEISRLVDELASAPAL